MNKLIKQIPALALIAIGTVGTAQAATIAGELFIGGEAVPVPGPGLGDAIALEFPSGFVVTNAEGDFAAAGLGFGDLGVINDLTFGALPIDPFILIGDFTFTLNSINFLEQDSDFLNLIGLGILSAPGFDDTIFEFSLSADGAGDRFAYSGTLSSTITVIPVPGALVLFMSGLAALGLRRRA